METASFKRQKLLQICSFIVTNLQFTFIFEFIGCAYWLKKKHFLIVIFCFENHNKKAKPNSFSLLPTVGIKIQFPNPFKIQTNPDTNVDKCWLLTVGRKAIFRLHLSELLYLLIFDIQTLQTDDMYNIIWDGQ